MDITRSPCPSYAGQSRPAPRRPFRAQWLAFFMLTGLFVLLFLPVMLLAGVYGLHMVTGRILPTLQVGVTPVGGLTRAEAEEKLNAAWNSDKQLVVSDGQRVWKAAPIELGLWTDPQASIEQAYQVGRGPDGLRDVFFLLTGGDASLSPHVIFNLDVGRAGLERLASQVDLPAYNATLRFENGQWVALPGQNGLSLNIPATLEQVAAQPQAIIASGYLPLVTQGVAPRVTDASPLLGRLQSALDQPVRIVAYDPISDESITWTVPREVLAGWLTVEISDDEMSFGLDGSQLNAFIEQQAASLAPERSLESFTVPPQLASLWLAGDPLTVLIHRQPTTYTVEAGDTLTRIGFKVGMPYWKIQQANSGLNIESLSAGMVLNIPSRNEMLPLPIVMGKRIVISISEQRMWTYENGQLRSEHIISTGINSSPTYPGVYQIQTHELNAYASVWDLYMPHFMGIYEGWPGFLNGIHGLPTLSSGARLWANVLGSPASYGCIILNLQDAEDLYNWAEAGVMVEIQK